ncbi:MAG: nitroreductase family protein [Cellulosilyticum sp.]|nr:nitroreductase family protein [Cellulosilyticum sp.]MEE1072112.1 nitroreductase family protein [Cellulosilyticum sp.]
MEIIEGIYKRKSIRKFKNEPVKREDIIECLKAACQAPSPKHQQNWHFVVIQNKELIAQIAKVVEERHQEIAACAEDEKVQEKFMKLMKYYTLFKNAPVLVVVYAKPYFMIEEKILKSNKAKQEIIEALKSTQSAAQAIGAAVENFLLTAMQLGYGTCYMTGPAHAKKEVENLIGTVSEEYELMSMIAMGVPVEELPAKPERLELEQVVDFID